MMGDAERINEMFSKLAEDYGYTGELYEAIAGAHVSYSGLVENMVRLFECRFDAEMKLIKEKLGVN